MSHVVEYGNYPEKVNRKDVQNEWDMYVQLEDWQEGASGASPIRWIESTICEDYDAAQRFIEHHDKGWYDCLAVRYRDFSKIKPTTQLQKLEERVVKCRTSLYEKERKFHFSEVKSEFIGCKSCGSKIATKHLKCNFCPVCRSDMRPASAFATIDAAKVALKKAETALAVEKKKYQQKCKEQAEIRWLVKIEFHQ
jgi:hypothetical protein